MLESMLMARLPESEEGYAQDEVWEGIRVLDLYAGSGALAIEALSRGAAWADLVDNAPAACKVIRRNLDETGLGARTRLYCASVLGVLGADSVLPGKEGYDIIALDPPYADPSIEQVVRSVGDSGLLRAEGLVVVEHSRRLGLAAEYGSLVRVRERTHGDTSVSVYRNQEASI
jgi:16S rRNA (guanine966-N2)-methyltransferase